MGPPGSLGGNAQRGPRTATQQAMVVWCSGPADRQRAGSASPNSMDRKPAHPDTEGIADDSRSEYREHQRPARGRAGSLAPNFLSLTWRMMASPVWATRLLSDLFSFSQETSSRFNLALPFRSDFQSVGWSIFGTATGFHSPPAIRPRSAAPSFHCRTSCTDKKPYPSRNGTRAGLR
jgi:hypothetical protein